MLDCINYLGFPLWLRLIFTFLSAFLGFGSALLIYYLNGKRDRRKEKERFERDKELEVKRILTEHANKKKYYKLLLENIINDVNKQIGLISTFENEQNSNLNNVIVPRLVVTHDFKRLIAVHKDFFDTTNYFFADKDEIWITDVKELHKNLDFIDGSFNEIMRITKNHTQTCYQFSKDIKYFIELIPDKLSSYGFFLQGQLKEERFKNDLYVFVDDSIKKFHSLMVDSADPEEINNEFLEPMIKEILEKYKSIPEMEELLFLSKKARVRMNDIRVEIQNIISVYNEIKEGLEKSINKISQLNLKINCED